MVTRGFGFKGKRGRYTDKQLARAERLQSRDLRQHRRKLTYREMQIVKGLWFPLNGKRRYSIGDLAMYMEVSKLVIQRIIDNPNVQPVYK